MKITCYCGSLIIDQSDLLPDKATFIADQDYEDLYEIVTATIRAAMAVGRTAPDDPAEARALEGKVYRQHYGPAFRYERVMWQCGACGRLYVSDKDRQRLHCFIPASDDVPKNLLSAVDGPQWKRHLLGNWRVRVQGEPPKGELSWFGEGDEGWEKFDDWEALERRYHEVFERLKEKNLLRSAHLMKDKIVHQWP